MSPEPTHWPSRMAAPADVLQWLNRQRPADEQGKKCLVALRWLVHAEIDRCAPEPPPKSITHFTPDEPAQTL